MARGGRAPAAKTSKTDRSVYQSGAASGAAGTGGVGRETTRRSARRRSGADEPNDNTAYPVSVFSPQHHLTPEQVFDADRCLLRARNERGALKGFRYSRRLGGIVSAAKAGRIGNSKWGRHMAGKRGGRAMAEKHLERLREMAPLAWRQSVEVRRLRKRRQDYERGRP
jgi:hypothetical protein